LEQALQDYKQRHADENVDPDEMIISAGDYLLRVLEPVQQHRDLQRCALAAAGGLALGLGAVLLLRRLWTRETSSSSSSNSSASSSSLRPPAGAATAAAGSQPAAGKAGRL
jgi:hypothetical protein